MYRTSLLPRSATLFNSNSAMAITLSRRAQQIRDALLSKRQFLLVCISFVHLRHIISSFRRHLRTCHLTFCNRQLTSF